MGLRVDVGVGDAVGVGVGVGVDLRIKTPLFQINFFPLFIQVNFLPLLIAKDPNLEQIAPAFGGVAAID